MPDGVLEASLVGEEDGIAQQYPVVDLRQLHHFLWAAHDGGDDEVLVGYLHESEKRCDNSKV